MDKLTADHVPVLIRCILENLRNSSALKGQQKQKEQEEFLLIPEIMQWRAK